MRIESSSLDFSSSHKLTSGTSRQDDLSIWNDRGTIEVHNDSVSISLNAKTATGKEVAGSGNNTGEVEETRSGRYFIILELLKKMAEEQAKELAKKGGNSSGNNMDKMTRDTVRQIKEYFDTIFNGKTSSRIQPVSINIPQLPQQAPVQLQQPQGWGVRFTSVRTYNEAESTAFNAQGTVRAGGKEFNINVSILMERSYSETETTEILAGNAARPPQDPLVINLGSGPAMLSGQKIQFDINADGADEEIAALVNTSGFLIIDKNSNGIVDDGSELFGPATDNGFGELATYDDDKNGWIDEADAVYSKLGVWSQQGGEAKSYQSLGELNIGAIFTGNVETQFLMNNSRNETQAAVRQTGIYLREDGTGGTVQKLDFVI